MEAPRPKGELCKPHALINAVLKFVGKKLYKKKIKKPGNVMFYRGFLFYVCRYFV